MDSLIDTLKTEAWEFVCSKAFIASASLFFVYLFVFGVLKKIKDCFVWICSSLFFCFGGLTLRRLFFNSFSLLFMVGGVSSASAANAKLNGREGLLEAIVGGGVSLAVWGFVMLLANQFKTEKPSAKQVSKSDVVKKS